MAAGLDRCGPSRFGGQSVIHKSLYRLVLMMGAALVAAACAITGGATSQKEDMLLSAGFVPKKADATAQMAGLKSLPAHQFVARNRNGRTLYLYADPTVCGCIYVGDQNAYEYAGSKWRVGERRWTTRSAPF